MQCSFKRKGEFLQCRLCRRKVRTSAKHGYATCRPLREFHGRLKQSVLVGYLLMPVNLAAYLLQQGSCGVGTEMSRLLLVVGITYTPGCKCNDRRAYMDSAGIEWCRGHVPLIAEWLKEEASKRGIAAHDLFVYWLIRISIHRASRNSDNGGYCVQ